MPSNELLGWMRTTTKGGQAMKKAACGFLITVLLLLVIALSYRHQWNREARAQCDAAQPLVAATATREQVERSIGAPTVAYGREDLTEIHRHFAGPKEADIQAKLPEGGRVLVYSKSNSIMFVYLTSDGKACDMRCFLQ